MSLTGCNCKEFVEVLAEESCSHYRSCIHREDAEIFDYTVALSRIHTSVILWTKRTREIGKAILHDNSLYIFMVV